MVIAVGAVGFFIEGTDANILALNATDHLLHLASGAFLILAAGVARQPRPPRSERTGRVSP